MLLELEAVQHPAFRCYNQSVCIVTIIAIQNCSPAFKKRMSFTAPAVCIQTNVKNKSTISAKSGHENQKVHELAEIALI